MRRIRASVGVCAALTMVTTIFADEAAWQALMQQAGAARKAEKPADAVKPLSGAVKEAEGFPAGDPRLVITLVALADTDDEGAVSLVAGIFPASDAPRIPFSTPHSSVHLADFRQP